MPNAKNKHLIDWFYFFTKVICALTFANDNIRRSRIKVAIFIGRILREFELNLNNKTIYQSNVIIQTLRIYNFEKALFGHAAVQDFQS